MATSSKKSSKKQTSTSDSAGTSKPARKPRGESARSVLGVALAILYAAIVRYQGLPDLATSSTPEQIAQHQSVVAALSTAQEQAKTALKSQGFDNYKSATDVEAEVTAEMGKLQTILATGDSNTKLGALARLEELTKQLKKINKKA